MSKRKVIVILSLIAVIFMIGFTVLIVFLNSIGVFEQREESWAEDWGSFTPYKAYSYDNKYYAVQTVEDMDMGPEWSVKDMGPAWSVVVVSVYATETDQFVADFSPARSRDFWGICWESDSYNIWTQSADIGVYCYAYQDGQWIRDENAVRPEDIVSKYD